MRIKSRQARSAPGAWRIALCAGLALCSLLLAPCSLLYADELSDARRDLALVRHQMESERQRYLAAKSEMERAALVATYLFPPLQAREKALEDRIKKLEEASK